MKIIELTQGKVTLVDDDVYEWASKFKWYARKCGLGFYAGRKKRVSGKPRTLYLHREILQPGDGNQIDHVNGDGLDNRRENLRVCTTRQNLQAFKRKRSGATSKFRGVTWHVGARKWCTRVQRRYVGLFDSEEDAAWAYNTAAKKIFGEFASLNL